MSTQPSGDVSLINDEDLLRKMWQDTEDFGRKKEIRAHMYKLREARLRDFYNSGEVSTDIKRSSTTTTESKSCSGSTHTDNLADHSFISMKTKEIRDSESPTKDDIYRISGKGTPNQGWTVVTSNKKSDDGKTYTTSKTATTSGIEQIQGGIIDYAAKNEQQASVYKDGDDKNFTKAVGASSNTFIKQEASGGDENSSFKSSSTKTSSSSKVVTEQRSTSGDVIQSNVTPSRMVTQNQNDDYLVSRKTYTENIPSELKSHPSYVEGKTKVTRETRTLPDGSTVTTTRYEIKGGNATQSSVNNQYSNTEQRSSSSTVKSSQAVDSRRSQNETKTTRHTSEQPTSSTTTITRQMYDSRDQQVQPATTQTITRTIKGEHVGSVDDSSKTRVIYDSRSEPRDDSTITKTTVVRKVYDSEDQPSTTQDSNVTRTTVIRKVYDCRDEPTSSHDSNVTHKTTVVKNVYVEPTTTQDSNVTTSTTVLKKISDIKENPITSPQNSNYTTRTTLLKDVHEPSIADFNTTTIKTTVIKNIYDTNDQGQSINDSSNTTTTKTTVAKQINDSKEDRRRTEEHLTNKINQHQTNEEFITTEQQDNQRRIEPVTCSPRQVRPRTESPEKRPQPEEKHQSPEKRPKPEENYGSPERRKPIKPGKSELGNKPKPTEGQYETTYRTDFTNKRISVEVSPTHDAFARSLRAVSPDRISKSSSPTRSLRTSTNSLRSSTSPEKNRHPSRVSPGRRSTSPRKTTSNETITYKTRKNEDTVTSRNNTTEIDSSTLTRRRNKPKNRSRSPSPTSIASDIEFIRNTNIITDLDTNVTTVITKSRPSSLEITKKTTKKVTERSPTSPLTDSSPRKTNSRDVARTNSLRNISPTKETSIKPDKQFKRTDTYEERCRQILGITNETNKRKNSLERTVTRRDSATKSYPEKFSPTKDITSPTRKSPERKSPTKDGPKIGEFPSQIKRSPKKEPTRQYPDKKSPVKESPKISEFPSQIRRSPEKEPLGPYPEKKRPDKDVSKINEFPSQIRRSPEKEPIERPTEKKGTIKEGPKISEFPSQIRKVPGKEPLEPYPEKGKPSREKPQTEEYPSQIRRSPEKEPIEQPTEKKGTIKEGPKISEFPTQIRKVPGKEPLEPYPEKGKPSREKPQSEEYPSQIRPLTEKELPQRYPENTSSSKEFPQVCEFPSQIRKSPEKEPLGPYPEKGKPIREGPTISEFPSQIPRWSEKEPLEPYPKKTSPVKESPQVSEFPTQTRKLPEREPLGPYPEKVRPTREGPTIGEFPSQVTHSPQKHPLESYPKATSPAKELPLVSEFPSQIRKSPEKEYIRPDEIPSYREPLDRYPQEEPFTIEDYPSQKRKSPDRKLTIEYPGQQLPEELEDKYAERPNDYPKKIRPIDSVFPNRPHSPESPDENDQVPFQLSEQKPHNIVPKTESRKSPEKKLSEKYPEKSKPKERECPKLNEFPSQVRKSPEKIPLEKYPEKSKPQKESPKIQEFPSQIRKIPEKQIPDKNKPRKSPQKETSEPRKKIDKLEYDAKIYPTTPSKKDKPRRRTDSVYSSSTDEEKDVEEIYSATAISELESRVPVDEPLVTKKFISQLCKDDEIQRTDLTRKESQAVLDREIIQTGTKTQTRIVKKDSPRKQEELFIDNERRDTMKKSSTPRMTSPTKKPLNEKNSTVTTTKSTSSISTKTDNKITRKVPDTKPKDVKKTTEKITLYDIENLNRTKEDNRIHIRTHRVDDTINKRIIKTTVNDDINKKTPIKRPQPVKPEETKPKKSVEVKPQKIVTKTRTDVETKRVTAEQKTPKRHVVTTTITVSPITRSTPTKSVAKTTPKGSTIPTPKSTITPKTTKPTNKKPQLQNGHVSSDEESIADSLDERLTEEISTSLKKELVTRTTSDKITKKKTENKIPTRGVSKPELQSKTKQEKCITTKSIIINNEATEREVIVDLQRSKSSREPTPDRICPLPVSSDDESTPRYPDQIAEPDDSSLKRKPKKLSDIPIIEGEDVTEFSRITEVEDETKTNVNRVDETDISLLSINKKISKFLDTTDKGTKPKQGPAPKVERPKLQVTEDLESDECLLSVSQKVNKFITTAEQLTTTQELPQRPKSPKCQYYPEDDVSVSDKVAHFITTAEKVVTTPKGTTSKVERPNFDDIEDTIREDECLLNVSDKVNKFINTADKLTTESKKIISLSKMDTKPTTPKTQESQHRVPIKESTPPRRPSNQYSSIKSELPESKYSRRDSSPKLPDSTPKSTRRPSEEDLKSVLSPTGRLRSTESVKKAKALFENISKDHQVIKQRDILSRPSVFEGKKVNKIDTARKLEYEHDEDERTLKSTRLLLDKVRARSQSPEKDTFSRRSQSPDGDLPGYMRPLDRSLRPNSPHRESVSQINKKQTTIKDEENTEVRQNKFGVTLRRTDSGRAITTTTAISPKSRVSLEGVTEAEIEEIYDCEILEELLEKVVNYDLRRKIRTQIRLVKKLISEGKLVEVTKTITTREKSPVKTIRHSKESVEKSTEYRSSYSYNERRSSSEYTKIIKRNESPETISEYKSSRTTRRSESPETKPSRITRKSQSPESKPTREKTPDKSSKKTSNLFQSQLKKTSLSSKSTTQDSAPEWVKQRNLRKVTDTRVTTTRSSTSTTSKKSRSSPLKETKVTDSVTSSYGVGPTDENGSPLFGLKALRAPKKTDTTKVQGRVIRSQYYSENGHEPIGEISVTNYSTDPRDLGRNEDVKTKGITSITTSQKFGYKDTPSLKTLTSSKKKKEICDEIEDELETKTTKVQRRGSVKAISQKFIEDAVETLKNEKQTSYPKAGLILRTSSFKESGSSADSREGSTERTVTTKTSSTRTVSGETFLTNRSKVSGVQDVITRMKSEDIREGDSAEDVEARGLLNKFLGAQVILSGLESNVKASTKTTNSKRSTKITTTTTEGGKPVTKTRVFQHPITDEDLQTVWDEQTLRLLLEQSTDYEERRVIRARLRQVMAEQEACTELVEKASQDQIGTTFEEATHTKKTFSEEPLSTSRVTTKVATTQQVQSKKPISPFAKFRQLDKQNSLNSPSTPKTPSGSGPLFKFTDPAVSQSASTIKDRLLHWCRMKTKEYENIQLDNFSTSWADGLAFCALIHHFLPDAFDYHALSAKNRRHNFTLAFQVADEKADIAPLLDVDDMVATRKPDWKCVFTYVQSIYRRFKDED